MKFKTEQSVWFEGHKWTIVEVFDGGGTPSLSFVILRLVSKAWYLVFSTVPHEVTVTEQRFKKISAVIGRG